MWSKNLDVFMDKKFFIKCKKVGQNIIIKKILCRLAAAAFETDNSYEKLIRI